MIIFALINLLLVIEPIVIESDDEEDSRPSTPSYSPLNSPERNEPQSKRKGRTFMNLYEPLDPTGLSSTT